MPVDTSIYQTTPPPNPLETYGKLIGIKNAQAQNKLLQQQIDMRAGLTSAYQGATDPTTGAIDPNRLLSATGQDPRTAGFQGDINAQAQANTKATAEAQQAQLQNIMAHTQAANAIISSTLSDPGLGKVDLRDKIVQGIQALSTHGDSMMTGATQKQLVDSVPADPQGQYQWIQQKAAENSAIQGKVGDILQRTYGSPVTVDNGQRVIGGVQAPVNPQAGGGALAIPQQAGVQKVTTPGENAALQPTYQQQPDGTYQAVQVPRSALPGASGVAGAPQGMPGSGAPANRLMAPQAAPVAPAGQILGAPPAGVKESQEADIAKFKSDQAAIPLHATNVQSLQKAQTALQALSDASLVKGGGTGAGTSTLAHLRSVVTSLTGAADANTMNYDEAKKYLTDYARQQGAAAHSDLQLQAAQGSNASTDISNAAALDVVKTNIGRERQAIAQVQENPNPTGIGYEAHASSFATSTDPRAFAWNEYNSDEQQKIIKSLTPTAKAKLVASLKIANKYGFTQPEGANGQQ